MATGGYVSGMQPGESIEEFINREVQPDTAFLKEIGEVIETVVQSLQKEVTELTIKEIIKGGSFGKGTGVKGKSDVDLLMVVNGFDLPRLKKELADILSMLNTIVSEIEFSAHGVDFKSSEDTEFSVQFKLKFHNNEWHEVDVLPTIDSLCNGKDAVYKDMEKNVKDRPYYSASLAKLQIEFVKKRDSKLKDVIRFMKYWKKTQEIDIVSYGIELIVIKVWEEQTSPSSLSRKELIKAVAKKMSKFGDLSLSWNENYDLDYYENIQNMKKPYIRDPANPFMNVIYHTKKFDDIEQKAKLLLDALQ